MITQNFLSPIGGLRYRYLCSDPDPSPIFSDAGYGVALCVPPRVWRQSIDFLTHLSAVPRKTLPDSDFAIWAMATVSTHYYPGWDVIFWEINGRTGEFVRHIDLAGNIGTVSLSWARMSRGGNMWLFQTFLGLGGEAYEYTVNPDSDKPLAATGQVLDYTMFPNGNWDNVFVAIDEINDVCAVRTVVDGTGGTGTPSSHISLHKWSDKSLIRHLPCCGKPIDAHFEEGSRIYVICERGMICLVDYNTGIIQSVTQVTLPSATYVTAYDRYLRRLLFLPMAADAVDGASQLQVYGFKDVPKATTLTKPIPLARNRVGQRTPVVGRLVGSAGEIVSGVTAHAELSNSKGTLTNTAAASDGSGYVTFEIDFTEVGDVDITLSGEV
jgi:hypothetical protein